MSVDDHGLEVLKKAGEEVTPGDKSDYYIKVGVSQLSSSSSAVASVAGSVTSVTLLASNANRKGASIFNDSTATLYVKFGATASTASFTVKLRQDETLVMQGTPIYSGVVDGIWDSATGNARTTELS